VHVSASSTARLPRIITGRSSLKSRKADLWTFGQIPNTDRAG